MMISSSSRDIAGVISGRKRRVEMVDNPLSIREDNMCFVNNEELSENMRKFGIFA